MFELASEDHFKKGEVIFTEGKSGDWVYVVISGSVEISKTIDNKKYVVALIKEGEVFGELSFLGNIKRTATAIALEDTVAGVIDRDSLDIELNKISSDFRAIIVSAVRRFETMLDRASTFSTRNEKRVSKTLTLTYKDKNAFLKAYTEDVSSGGIFIQTKKPLPQGEQFILKLQLPNIPEPLGINAIVAWSRGEGGKGAPGMGVRFQEMSEKDRQVFIKYYNTIRSE